MSQYDIIVVGTGFSASIFLSQLLQRFPKYRALVLDKGEMTDHLTMLREGKWVNVNPKSLYTTETDNKHWAVTPSFGGNSNYWIGNTPRFIPSDFKTFSLFNRGQDWPITYDDLEQDYSEAEQIMGISGSDTMSTLGYRSKPYPQPPHNLSEPDKILLSHHPQSFFPLPTARARKATKARTACCATTDCMYCPVDAKFRVGNELSQLYHDERITLISKANVVRLEKGSSTSIAAVEYLKDGQLYKKFADLVVLAANPIFNSYILLNSGLTQGNVGKGLMDHPTYFATLLLNGVKNFTGSTRETGIGFQLYDNNELRKNHAGCIFVTSNAPDLRPEWGRWQEVIRLEIPFEDIPSNNNYVSVDKDNDCPHIVYGGPSQYTLNGREQLEHNLGKVLSSWPIEHMEISPTPSPAGGAHIMGTHRMGTDPAISVTDSKLIHHSFRNLILLGGGSFVTPSAVNPTLTISALAHRSARLL